MARYREAPPRTVTWNGTSFWPPGTYSLRLWFPKGTNQGIATVYIDGVSTGQTIDLYGTFAAGQEATLTGLLVASSGHHTIRLKGETRNGSSSAYAVVMNALSLTRTGA